MYKTTKPGYVLSSSSCHGEKDIFEHEAKSTYTLRSRIYYTTISYLYKLTLPIAILSGCGITAGTTYALVRWVQHSIHTAAVDSNPAVWIQAARTKAYDACYYGCADCSDTWWAYNACAMTAKANVTGVICDGNKIWNWRDRYPIECMRAVGEFYRADALKALKQSYRNRLAIIILTVLAGVIGAIVVFVLWKKVTAAAKENARVAGEQSRTWPKRKPSFPDVEKPTATPGNGRSHRKFALLGGLAVLARKTNAYPCTGYDSVVDHYFVNANQTLFGVIHGYLSDCYDYSCNCITTCSGGSASICSVTCSTCTGVSTQTVSYVNRVVPKVESCGFKSVDAVEGDVNLRVASALIEKNWWVKISVNTYNLTDETDPSVMCLHAIGG